MYTEPLSRLPFWQHLTPAQQAAAADQCRRVEYAAGQAVHSPGEGCLGVLLIESGALRIYLSSPEGRQATIDRLHAGQICVMTAACMMRGVSFDVQVEAESDTAALLLPARLFAGLMQENIYVEAFLYRAATERFASVLTGMEQMLFLTLEQRVASFLLDEAARTGSDAVRVTQEQLAQAIGSAREAVSRTLKKLERQGLVTVERGAVRLTDRPALYRLL